MPHVSWKTWITWLLAGNLVAWVANAVFFGVLILLGSSIADLVRSSFFSKMALLETGIAFLIGGALAFSGSVLPSKAQEQILKRGEPWSMDKLKKSEKRANKFIVLAVILFLESLAISFFGV
jgi:hypothetical protein